MERTRPSITRVPISRTFLAPTPQAPSWADSEWPAAARLTGTSRRGTLNRRSRTRFVPDWACAAALLHTPSSHHPAYPPRAVDRLPILWRVRALSPMRRSRWRRPDGRGVLLRLDCQERAESMPTQLSPDFSPLLPPRYPFVERDNWTTSRGALLRHAPSLDRRCVHYRRRA